jgi:hypothetical protein
MVSLEISVKRNRSGILGINSRRLRHQAEQQKQQRMINRSIFRLKLDSNGSRIAWGKKRDDDDDNKRKERKLIPNQSSRQSSTAGAVEAALLLA